MAKRKPVDISTLFGEMKMEDDSEEGLAVISRIDDVIELPHLRDLVYIKVNGYNVLFDPEDIQIGGRNRDLIGKIGIFFKVGTILPPSFDNNPFFYRTYHSSKGLRITNIIINGTKSEGLFVPFHAVGMSSEGWNEGVDLTKKLGLKSSKERVSKMYRRFLPRQTWN